MSAMEPQEPDAAWFLSAPNKDRFWVCDYPVSPRSRQRVVVSTAEAVCMLREGFRLRVIAGPHSTLAAASDSADSL